MDEQFRFFGIRKVGEADEDEEDVGKSQYFDALETVEEVEEAIAQAAVIHAEDGLKPHSSVRPLLNFAFRDNSSLCMPFLFVLTQV